MNWRFCDGIDTFTVIAGVHRDLESAEADYELVQDLHRTERLMDAYDAAVIHRRADGKVKITKKHETPTRVGGVLEAERVSLPVSSSRSSRSRRSAVDCWWPRRRAARSSVLWPGMPRRA